MGYLTRNAGALSQAVNAALLNGHPNESLSAHTHRAGWTRAEKLIDAIFFWQPAHCRAAYLTDVEWARAYVIDYEYRQLQARRTK
jgi:hypothetical protein